MFIRLEINEGTHQLCLEREEEQSRYINDFKNDIETYQTDNILLQKEFEKLNCRYGLYIIFGSYLYFGLYEPFEVFGIIF